nr:probable transmembrane ascorbate ferrireductase 3 [Ipomoea batatas]
MYAVYEGSEYRYYRSATRLTGFAQLFGFLALILMLVWLLHYREGLNLDDYENTSRIFNVHPFLMYFGFIFFAGQAMMAYKTVMAARDVQKFTHMLFHVIAICLGIVGIHAVFKFHDKENIGNMYSLHSWIGIATISLYILQWVIGLVVFLFPYASQEARLRLAPWHITGGRALLYMAICAAETGLMQKATFLNVKFTRESTLINVLGIVILLFGISVDISVALSRYV